MKENPEFKSPLLKRAWALMPEGIRQTVTSEPNIPAIPGSVFGAPKCLRFGYAEMTREHID
jgi:hypothetical protein